LINLLGNAIKFTERGQIALRATLESRECNQLWFSASVEDTGLGLSDEEQSRLFEPFSQVNNTINIKEGTGLGLAISREYARLMAGDLTVMRNAAKGSIFRVEVPVGRGDSGMTIRVGALRHVVGVLGGQEPPRVLVVDDQFENRDWLVKFLAVLGFQVKGADSGSAAIQTWEDWKPQLILMDVHMPLMDGLEATRRIKAAPGGEKTIIIILTASAMDEQRDIGLQSGADDFVGKPFNQHELLEKIRVFLGIDYEYEDSNDGSGIPAIAESSLRAEKLAQLPAELLAELRVATFKGKKKLIDKLILEVREAGFASSAVALQRLADNYDYAALSHSLEEACRS
jgi:CheY-like chemotaxis protein